MLVKIICIILAGLIVLVFSLPTWYSGLDTQKGLAKYGKFRIYKKIKYFPEKSQQETFYYAKVKVGELFGLFPVWTKWRRCVGEEVSYHIDYSKLKQELEFGFNSFESPSTNWWEKFLNNVSDVFQTKMNDDSRKDYNSTEYLESGEFNKKDKA